MYFPGTMRCLFCFTIYLKLSGVRSIQGSVDEYVKRLLRLGCCNYMTNYIVASYLSKGALEELEIRITIEEAEHELSLLLSTCATAGSAADS